MCRARVLDQFKPCTGAQPAIGEVGVVEHVEADRVELMVNDKGANEEVMRAIQELKSVRYLVFFVVHQT